MDMSHLGKSIRNQREKLGLNQESFSRASGIPRRTLTRLECGDPAVRIGTFERAARALGLGLTLHELRRRRPTLEELAALYRDEDAGGEAPETPQDG